MTREGIKRLASLANSMSMDADLILALCGQEVLTSQHHEVAQRMKGCAENIMAIHNTLVKASNG